MSNNSNMALMAAPTTALAETSTAAQAAQAQAQALARYAMAERHPRNWLDVRTALLRECQRPKFAATSRYSIPFKKWNPETRQQEIVHVIGLSIRFAEAAARLLKNIDVHIHIVFDDDSKRITSVVVTDIEANTSYSKDAVVEKVMERKTLSRDQKPLRTRTNSYGEQVFLIPATEADVLKKCGSEVSKAIRDCVLRLLPGDIKEECMEMAVRTIEDENAKDPESALRDMVAAFASVGVKAEQIEQLLEHPLAGTAPAELAKLRAYYSALADGMATWAELVECESTTPTKKDDPNAKLRAELQERLHKHSGKKPRSKVEVSARHPRSKPAEPVEIVDPLTGEVTSQEQFDAHETREPGEEG